MEAHIIEAMAQAQAESTTQPIERVLWAHTTQGVRDLVEEALEAPQNPPLDPPSGTPLLVAYLQEREALDESAHDDDGLYLELERTWRE